jgi:hypothetical protein
MSELEPVDHALLDLARGGHEPTDEDRTRLRGRLAARLGVAAGLTLASTTIAASSSGAAAVAGGGAVATAAKVLAGLAVLTAIGGGSVAYFRAVGSAPRQAVASSPVSHSVVQTAETHGTVAVPVAPPSPRLPEAAESPPATAAGSSPALQAIPVSPKAVAAPPVLSAPTSRSASSAPVEPLQSPPAVGPASTTLEAETRLLLAGIAALHAGDAVRALAFFDEHARDYPSGVLAEERAVERILALCSLGRSDDVRAAASAFLAAHPGSPLAPRVRASCAAAN